MSLKKQFNAHPIWSSDMHKNFALLKKAFVLAFHTPLAKVHKGIISRPVPLGIGVLIKYIVGMETPARILQNKAIKELMPMLKGEIVELGADKAEDYGRFATSSQKYTMTNISGEGLEYLDMMNMHYEANSIDAFTCFVVFEHISAPKKAIDEIYRVLRPGGKLFLTVPFIFPFHGAPDDFYRFSPSAIKEMLAKFNLFHFEALGNHYSAMALFLQSPRWHPWPLSVSWWPWDILLRIIGLIFYILSRLKVGVDDYAMLYCLIAEKEQ
ncbi:class I SAM-dependent methyltransferase [Patescibacteria group bacterium]|nr:class I SAM-dependent methyltransferase [Patescibacteria group bacterium]